ncbi:MAG: glycosyltransferase [Novosphingobium sp.]
MSDRKPRIALLFAQFAAYHVDRCEAVARRLADRADVLAVEVCSTSQTYAWEPSGQVNGASKLTLFPGQAYEAVSAWRRLVAQFRVLRHCRMVLVGIGYNERDIILLSWLLWLCRVRVVVMSESKYDDFPRSPVFERLKAALLTPYSAAIVGAQRHMAYFRFLGFRRRKVLPGYDGVGVERVRRQAEGMLAPDALDFAQRPFVYVGRFVEKKNLFGLLEGYAAYAGAAGPDARRLVLAGSGELEPQLRAQADALGLSASVEFPGFLPAGAISRLLSRALALVLVSTTEQWGLVVNEALALGLPVIVSDAVGAGDALVREGVNGYIVEGGSSEGIARAMAALAGDKAQWRAMGRASLARAWMGDTERLADAVELLLDPDAEPAQGRMREFIEALGDGPEKGHQ